MFECNERNGFLESIHSHTHTDVWMDPANKTGKAQQSLRVKEIHDRPNDWWEEVRNSFIGLRALAIHSMLICFGVVWFQREKCYAVNVPHYLKKMQ